MMAVFQVDRLCALTQRGSWQRGREVCQRALLAHEGSLEKLKQVVQRRHIGKGSSSTLKKVKDTVVKTCSLSN